MIGLHATDKVSAPRTSAGLPARTPALPVPPSSVEPAFRTLCILIPAWQPTVVLTDLVADLLRRGFGWITVVDDGSTEAALPVLAALKKLPGIEVLHHPVNQGKGRALKTGFAHLLAGHRELAGVVTADADGQHTPADIERVARALLTSGPPTGPISVLGSRGFNSSESSGSSGSQIPWRSRLGNTLTRHVFRLLTGTRLRDTQTGLRGLPRDLLPELLALEGERYEYEIAALAHLCRAGRTPLEVPIETVYLDRNRGTHFHPLWDSLRVYAVLLRLGARTLFASANRTLTACLPPITGLCVAVQLLSLRLGLLRRFFFDTLHADVQGIDFYSLPKAWLNLAARHCLYATFDPPTYGPHFTWYLAHPLLAVLLGGPLSRLDPSDSYGVFTLLSLGVMASCAFLLAREASGIFSRRLIWLLLLGAFPAYAMLYVGNVQAFTVLALSLLWVGLLRLGREAPNGPRYVLAGLLVSLFTKPVVLLMLPLLLLLPETRRATFRALAIYLPVSLLFEITPFLNPEAVGLPRVLWLAAHPGFVRRTMNIYANHLALTPDMRDNSIHWFNLIAQAGTRQQHIDVFSLPVFLDGLLNTRTPGWLYALPTLAVLALSVLVPHIRNTQTRRESALLLTLAASLSFFLSYPTVWEYQYTAILPVAATLLVLRNSRLFPRRTWAWSFGLAASAWLPSLYVFSGSAAPTPAIMALVRLDHVLPVTALFFLLLWIVARATWRPSLNAQRPSAAATTPDYSSPVETPA